jgi:hypothetical protein
MTPAAPQLPRPSSCPVCGARFRSTAICSRCKSDLVPLMRIAARAWAARERCRSALNAGDLSRALRLDAQARRLHRDMPTDN